MTHRFPIFPNQGQRVAAGWDNVPALKNITAYVGTDGIVFLPVSDRGPGSYSLGIDRELNTGGVLNAGMPIVRWVSSWIGDGQLRYLQTVLLANAESGNVTIATHTPISVGIVTTSTFNAVLNLRLNQLRNLERKDGGYRDYEWEFKIVEAL